MNGNWRELGDTTERRKVDILCAEDQVEGKQGQEHWEWIQAFFIIGEMGLMR